MGVTTWVSCFFWYQLTRVVPNKGLLGGCCCVVTATRWQRKSPTDCKIVFYQTRVYPVYASRIRHLLLLSFRNQTSWTTIVSWMPSYMQITEELQTMSFDNAIIETVICILLKFNFYFRFCWPVSIKFALLNLSSIWKLCQSIERQGDWIPKTAKIEIGTSL